jgi:hypothetical protein
MRKNLEGSLTRKLVQPKVEFFGFGILELSLPRWYNERGRVNLIDAQRRLGKPTNVLFSVN